MAKAAEMTNSVKVGPGGEERTVADSVHCSFISTAGLSTFWFSKNTKHLLVQAVHKLDSHRLQKKTEE